RHLVDLGQAQEARDGDRPLAAPVRAEHRRLELERRARFDVVEGQTLLAPNCPEALTHACSGRRHLISSLAPLRSPPVMRSAWSRCTPRSRELITVHFRGHQRTVGNDRTSTLRESHASPRSQHQPRERGFVHISHSRHTRPALSIKIATAAIGAVSALRTYGPSPKCGISPTRARSLGAKPPSGPTSTVHSLSAPAGGAIASDGAPPLSATTTSRRRAS